jgi:hypothetical protein
LESTKSNDDPQDFHNANSDIGIVIQGPLVSRGRTGATSHIARHNVTEDDVVDFECIDNIAQLFEAFPNFGKMICVVWSSEPVDRIQRLQREIGENNVLVIDDNTRAVRAKSGVLPANNKYRQFLSSLKGIQIIEGHGCKYALKIRSDQYLDLYDLAQDLLKISAIRREFMMVPRIAAGSKTDHLVDFYIGGKTLDLLRCFDHYLKSPQMYEHVHTDIFYHWASLMLGKTEYPPRLLGLKLNPRYIQRAWNEFFCPASLAVFDSLLWRGEKAKFNQQQNIFLEDIWPDLLVTKALLK